MANYVCPWWFGYALANPLRKLVHDPVAILSPLVKEGMTVLEPGCGMGFFTLDLARMVGPNGRVIAVDLQPKMLSGLRSRVLRAGLYDRVETRLAKKNEMGTRDLIEHIDFALAFYMVHELPNAGRFFRELMQALKPGGKVLVTEPLHHVTEIDFEQTLAAARREGFVTEIAPEVRWSRTALLAKN